MKITSIVVLLLQLTEKHSEGTNLNNDNPVPGDISGYNVKGCKEIYVNHTTTNAYIILNSGTLSDGYNTVGTRIKFDCLAGFTIDGSSVIECMSTGEYVPPQPTCQTINYQCPPIEHSLPDNAKLLGRTNGNSVGSIANYTCTVGYVPQETYQKFCSQTFRWQLYTDELICLPIMCRLPVDKNGFYVFTGQTQCGEHKDEYLQVQCTISLVCNEGFTRNTETTRTCMTTGNWNNAHLKCVQIQCSISEGIKYGLYNYHDGFVASFPQVFDYGTRWQIVCDNGHTLIGHNTTSCQSNGHWSFTNQRCHIVQCITPIITNQSLYYVFHDGNSFASGLTYFNTTIYAMCDRGYLLESGSYSRTCLANGTWSGEADRCTAVNCPIPSNHEYVFTINGNDTVMYTVSDFQTLPFNTYINVTCKEQNVLINKEELLCTENGTWDSSFPACKLVSAEESSLSKKSGVIGGVVGSLGVILVAGAIIALLLLYRKRFSDKECCDTAHRVHLPNIFPPRRRTRQQRTPNTDNEYSSIRGSSINGSAQYADYADVPTEYVNTSLTVRDEGGTYYAFDLKKMPSAAIQVQALSDFVLRDDNMTKTLEVQFEKISAEMIFDCNEARKSIHIGKNRYRNIYPYDQTRVVLDKTDQNQPDYINASYIHGFNGVNAYIAAQAPLTDTLSDFWSMIWQTEACKIVMLTNLVEAGKDKCEQYWPDEQSLAYGSIVVTLKRMEEFSDFVIRTFTVTKNGLDKTITQFHFTAWPDKGVPKYASSLVQFRNKIHYDPSQGKGPILVHCSAGIGRTGTFIALDILTDQAHALGYVDVVGTVESLRKQRAKFVQNKEQYVFLHYTLIETLMLATSALSATQFQEAYELLMQFDESQQKRKLDMEFETLTMLSPVTDDHQYVTAKQVRNRRKNRYSSILPVGELMPRIGCEDDYINAVFLSSYKSKRAFIITQTPLEDTIEDFWKVIVYKNVHTIVMMNSLEETMKSERYWPKKGKPLTFCDVRITTENTEIITGHTVLAMEISSQNERRTVRQVQCNGWPSESYLPDSPDVILTLLHIVQSWQQQTGNQTIAVHCMNGVDKSGLFCVISAVIERMKIEQDVAINHVIEEMRNARQQIIPTVEQYQFCHEAVMAYMEQHATYSNFSLC